MGSQPDPLLLELFESVHDDLAKALEMRQRLFETSGDAQLAEVAEQTERIAKLQVAMAALEGALERRETGIVH
jgi:hypothetical protein